MPLRRARALLDRRLEWRLLAVFLAAALIPLAASDWIATGVLDGIVQRLAHDRDNLAARTVARQVFDRLLLSRTLLLAVDEAPGTARTRLAASVGGPQAAFARVACADSQDAGWTDLQSEWARARSGAAAPTSAHAGIGAGLRLAATPAGNATLLMATGPHGAPRCIAVLNPDHVWESVHDQSDDSAWRVRADDGSQVLAWHGAEAAADDAGAATAARFSAHLFLASEFGAGNWTLEQRTPPPTVAWHGMPVAAWLASVAAATLLLIGLVARRTIRRALAPLETLTDGARRLAAGIEPARVDIRRGDELGKLATSFNDMAAQLEQRIASLRALGRIDDGILQGTPFTELACGVLERLAQMQPQARIAVAWPVSATWLATVRHPAVDAAPPDEVCELPADAMARFTDLDDGLAPRAALQGLEAAIADDPADGTPCLVLGVRDGEVNRALITLHGVDPAVVGDEARALRDRLAVAVVARDRQDRLEHRATHDPLTGLVNTDGLQHALAPLLEGDDELAVLFIDLDHFKDVNDCYGHATGDRLLQAAARRLRRGTPDGALIARSGGDEFVVVLPACDAARAREAAGRILGSLDQPFIIAANEHRTGASIGVALYPTHALDREDLLRCADIAMYESKRQGRNRATVFEPALDTQVRERNELLSALARALERSEFVLHYQPRLDAATGHVVAAEALVRWQHPQRGLLLPGVFIDLAESSGHIDALGRIVMASAIARIAQWDADGRRIDRVSVNVSQHQFAGGELVAHVEGLLRQHGVPGSRLEIEVTESVLGGDVDSVRRQLHQLRELGVTVAMDDFGTGYSSLAQLRTLPIDVMKVDRAFVKDLATDPAAVAIVRTIVTLARALGLQVVAEGIETPAQAALLADIGCDQFQGFLYSRPVPPDQCAALGPFEIAPATA
jgi:diguanylate cyclase (GGDEF)-like protein